MSRASLLGAVLVGGGGDLVAGLVETLLDARAFGVEDFPETALEVLDNGVHVVLLELLAALVLEAFHQLAEPAHLLPVGILHPVAEQLTEGPHDVALLEKLVGELVHEGVGVDAEDFLGAVPAAVTVGAKEHGGLGRASGGRAGGRK